MRKNMKKFLASAFGALALVFAGGAVATADFTATAEAAPQLYIRGYNLRLADNVQVMFGVEARNIAPENVQILVWQKSAPAEYTYNDANNVKLAWELGENEEGITTLPSGDQGLVFFYDGIAVKEMLDSIYICAYAEVDGKEYYSEVEKYSIVEYSYNKLEQIDAMEEPKDMNADTDEVQVYKKQLKLKAVIEAMLHYGAAMQIYANYNVDAPVNALLLPDETEDEKLVRVEVANATFNDGFNYGFFMSNTKQVVSPNYGYSYVEDSQHFTVTGDDIELTIPKGKSYVATGAFSAPSIVYETMENGDYKVVGIGTEFTGKELVILPEQDGKKVTAIGKNAIAGMDITKIFIPSTITTIEDGAIANNQNLSIIEVDESNANYKSVDGNLYSKDGKTLCQYAIGKTDTAFVVPTVVTKFNSFAFAYANNLKSLGVSTGLKTVAEDAFAESVNFSSVYYTGTASEWASVAISTGGNAKLTMATVNYYNENVYYLDGEVLMKEINMNTSVVAEKVTLDNDEDVIVEDNIVIPEGKSLIISCDDIVKNLVLVAKGRNAAVKVFVSVAADKDGNYTWVELTEYQITTRFAEDISATANLPIYQCFKVQNVSTVTVQIEGFTLGVYSAQA